MTQTYTPILTMAQMASIDRYFRNNISLYQAFSQACRQQFSKDIEAMNAAVRSGQSPLVRRNAHSLKTVFEMLGYPALQAQALALEHAADAADTRSVERLWPLLREQILPLHV